MARTMRAGDYAREPFRTGGRIALAEVEGELVGIETVGSRIETTEGAVIVPNRQPVEDVVEKRAERAPERGPDSGE